MGFRWKSFLDANHIDYLEKGKNVAHGSVNVKCPFCGDDDPSEHMGMIAEGRAWGCWRNPQHRGASPERLIVALKGCSWDEAKKIAGSEEVTPVGLDALAVLAEGLFKDDPPPPPRLGFHKPLEEFRLIKPRGITSPYYDYLSGPDRCFAPEDVPAVIAGYQLRCAVTGRWRGRIIMPFLIDGGWGGWTGRAVGAATLRYVTYPSGDEVKELLYNQPALAEGGLVLAIVEGPFDAVKLDFYGRGLGVRAVSLLTTSASATQRRMIVRAARFFELVVILLDEGAEAMALVLAEQLAAVQPAIHPMREGDKDPGGLAPPVAVRLARRLLRHI